MKKWWIGVAALVVVLLIAVIWVLFQPPTVRVLSHDPAFAIYDVRYYPQTNQFHYWHWRTVWRDALRFVGLMQSVGTDLGPALVVYHSLPTAPARQWVPAPAWVVPDGESNGLPCNSIWAEYFGNKCVTKLFCPLTNGHYHLKLGETNWADIEVQLKR